MPISQAELVRASGRMTANLGIRYGAKRGFLCHSHSDQQLALGLHQLLSEQGLDLYIDWQDSAMPPEPNKETALRIQGAIRQSDVFLFLATQNSMQSRWCPWEIGFANGCKNSDWVGIVQTSDSNGRFYGSEYLQLYRRVDSVPNMGGIYWFPPGSHYPNSMRSF